MTEIIVSDQSNALSTEVAYSPAKSPAAALLASLGSDGSRNTYERHLRKIADLLSGSESKKEDGKIFRFPWHELRKQHTNLIRASLTKQYAPATVNLMLSALRQVLYHSWDLELMGAEDYRRAANLKNVKSKKLPKGRDLKSGELFALLDACDDPVENDSNTPLAIRDAAIIAVLYNCGLRRAELVSLDIANYDRENGQLKVLGGKGDKDRIVYVKTGAPALNNWLAVRGSEPGPLFLPIRRGGHIEYKRTDKETGEVSMARLTSQAVYNMLRKRGKQANVKDFSPHDFRRTFVGDMLDKGADISVVSKLAGHASVKTTAEYDRRPEAAKEKAAELLDLPYRGNLAAKYLKSRQETPEMV